MRPRARGHPAARVARSTSRCCIRTRLVRDVDEDQVGKDQVAKDQSAKDYAAKDYVLRIKDTFRTHHAQKRHVQHHHPPPRTGKTRFVLTHLLPAHKRPVSCSESNTPVCNSTPHRNDPFRTHRTQTTRFVLNPLLPRSWGVPPGGEGGRLSTKRVVCVRETPVGVSTKRVEGQG